MPRRQYDTQAPHERSIADPAAKTLALLNRYDLIDDFVDSLGMPFAAYCREFVGSWMFGYIDALRRAGVRTVLFVVSARVDAPARFMHLPTGATVCVLPAPKAYLAYRAARRRFLDRHPARRVAGSNDAGHSPFARLRVLAGSLGTYLATPLRVLAREIRREGCHAILCQEYENPRFEACVLLGRRMQVPVFATFQGGDETRSSLEYPLRRRALRACAGLIIPAQHERERVRTRYGIASAKIAGIFDPVDTETWYAVDRGAARRALGIPHGARVVVWHGRIEIHKKGLDVLLGAWAEMCRRRPDQDLRLLMVGTGSDARALHRHLATEGLRGVMWVDRFVHDRSLLRQYLSAGDVYVLPSRSEGLPVAPIEAMACGLPVVSADASGMSDILEGGEASGGLVVPRGDGGALAAALALVLDDEVWRRELGARARARVERCFSPSAIGGKLREFIFASPDACVSAAPR